MVVAAGLLGRWLGVVRALRARGMIVLRAPAQQGVQQDAEDRQECRDVPHECSAEMKMSLGAELIRITAI